MHRWYQLSLEEALAYEKEGLLLPGKGFRYKHEQGSEMVEIHVDEKLDNKLLTEINSKLKYGGNLSIHKQPEEKPLISFGHDECIFFNLFSLAHHGVDLRVSRQSFQKMKAMA